MFVRLKYQWCAYRLAELPSLKVIVSPTTGLDHIDLEACKRRGIVVLSLQGETDFLGTIPATAEHTWGLMLALTRRTPWAFDDVRKGCWQRDAFRGHDLKGKTLGIVGFGRVGEQVAKYAQTFGMGVVIFDPYSKVEWFNDSDPYYPMHHLTLVSLLQDADVVSIHVPLNDETRSMFGAEQFAAMKPGAVLVNTSRGEIIDEAALLEALESGKLAGAALDVISGERGDLWENKLLKYAREHDNLLITPHLGGCTVESMAATEVFMAKKLKRFLEGDERNDHRNYGDALSGAPVQCV